MRMSLASRKVWLGPRCGRPCPGLASCRWSACAPRLGPCRPTALGFSTVSTGDSRAATAQRSSVSYARSETPVAQSRAAANRSGADPDRCPDRGRPAFVTLRVMYARASTVTNAPGVRVGLMRSLRVKGWREHPASLVDCSLASSRRGIDRRKWHQSQRRFMPNPGQSHRMQSVVNCSVPNDGDAARVALFPIVGPGQQRGHFRRI